VLVVDDSSSVRTLLSSRLQAQGYEVDEASDAEGAAASILTNPPDVVVTDLVMEGLSGVQLCRLLRSEPTLAHMPVVLLTASGDRRSRYWARSAGAAAYVSKDRLEDLVAMLPTLIAQRPGGSAPARHGRAPGPRALLERISSLLDTALFESVIAGEVRALASIGDFVKLFESFSALLSDVLGYRWLAIAPARPHTPMFVHAHAGEAQAAEDLARAALGCPRDRAAHLVADDRPVSGGGQVAEVVPIALGGANIGRLALGPAARGLSRDERRMLALVATELAGPLQMISLYDDARRLATTDTLTGLLNRRAFLDAMDRERARSERHVFPLSLLLLDVDHFKRVNDTRGHAAGDAVLQAVARILASVARRSDIVARWGGEEFVVALPQTGEAGARIAAERVRRAIAEAVHPMPEGDRLGVTASIGVASADAPWSTDSLVRAADEAMYAAKARGRNRVEAAPSADAGPQSKRMRAVAP
jgi:two-component system cell cycle response regulator